MTTPTLIATRKSPLALKQTEMVRARLAETLPQEEFANLELTTKVDERLNWSLEKRGGIGLFTKELEDALLDHRAELAIHSAKDMPTVSPAGLAIAGYLPRARVNDVLVHRNDCPIPKTIATSSPRRRAQLGILFPSAEWTTIRGNVGTRLRKIAEGECEASLLAAAGLDRLEIESYPGSNFIELPVHQVVPAPGQAAIAVQCRSEDLAKYENLFCAQTQLAVTFEKGFLQRLGSGCQIPVGAYYKAGLFRVFHPEVGHQEFKITLESMDQIEPELDAIMKELKL
ncbi:hydroxymethylbilane synthase [Coraliomargarita sp. SDUM461004]|uniref:Hydroxymethylbilane synthase n=1 Tax=Thalassobacterium sedimentorum TaxID=3041258 RepID=A0ABU1AKK0_9BACT|nr:hydroxymethylbilane synthase [Coraliomargarita sp. SDUM461004]MDQ8194271.1 hydroxymethylbilane synthase [Coraliomargarita sp. SDUM461004]